MNDQAAPNQTQPSPITSYLDEYLPPLTDDARAPMVDPIMPAAPAPTAAPAAAAVTPSNAATTTAGTSETLEEQNIFDLLGVKDGTDQEKEAFLDELQQVIWEDFLENDVKLLLTTDELAELDVIVKSVTKDDLEKQEKIVVFLEKLIPDLEEIMLEKALELKADLVKERISGMKEYYATNQQALAQIDQAQQKLDDNQWRSAAQLLNSLS